MAIPFIYFGIISTKTSAFTTFAQFVKVNLILFDCTGDLNSGWDFINSKIQLKIKIGCVDLETSGVESSSFLNQLIND